MRKSEKILQLRNQFKKFIDAKEDVLWMIEVPIEENKILFEKYAEKIKDESPLLYWLVQCDKEIKELLTITLTNLEDSAFIVDPLGIANELSNIQDKIDKNIITRLITIIITSVIKEDEKTNILSITLTPKTVFNEFIAL